MWKHLLSSTKISNLSTLIVFHFLYYANDLLDIVGKG